MNGMNFDLIDLFSGCGALSLGFVRSSSISNVRYVPRLAIDLSEPAIGSYKRNFPTATVIAGSVDAFPWAQFESENPCVIVGGPPCQGFSQHTKRSGYEDPRNSLVGAFAAAVLEVRPMAFILENVPGVQDPEYGVWEAAVQLLKQDGYRVSAMTLNASAYGVPQSRVRTFMCGVQRPALPVAPPRPTHGVGLLPLKTVRHAILDLPPLESGQASIDPLHASPSYDRISIERFYHIPPDGGSRTDLPEHLRLECHKADVGYKDVYGRMHWDRPAPTITRGCLRPSKGRFTHPEQHRGITLREAARLQDFPDDFAFSGTNQDIASQIGNAVPVGLAQAVARAVSLRLGQLIDFPLKSVDQLQIS
jgi:DNA (cytosine-5)-methyltransferase 1